MLIKLYLAKYWRNIKFCLPELMVSFIFFRDFYFVDVGSLESHRLSVEFLDVCFSEPIR